MNNKIIIGIGLILFVIISGCTKSPTPQLRIRNDQAVKVSVMVQTTASAKINFDNVVYDQTTPYQDVPEGNLTATSITQNESVSFLAEKNMKYTVVISEGNPPMIVFDK